MRDIALFVEDFAHKAFLEALIVRLSKEAGIPVGLRWANARRGHGAVVNELKQYVRDLLHDRQSLPDLIIVATDANCKGLNQRTKDIAASLTRLDNRCPVVLAIPDPHIERWLLIDSAAFKAALGSGCASPDFKCARDRYKNLLLNAVRDAGLKPLLGGIEFTEDIVNAMDIQRTAQADPAFNNFLSELQRVFRQWQAE